MCLEKKEMKLKYELENNVNLVSFSNMNIEISFNDKLNKSFIKEKGEMSEKEKKNSLKKKDIKDYESSNEFKNLLNAFPDIELINIEKKDD